MNQPKIVDAEQFNAEKKLYGDRFLSWSDFNFARAEDAVGDGYSLIFEETPRYGPYELQRATNIFGPWTTVGTNTSTKWEKEPFDPGCQCAPNKFVIEKKSMKEAEYFRMIHAIPKTVPSGGGWE